MTFRAGADVRREDLAVRGGSVARYGVSEFDYDADTRTATWTLDRSVVADRITLELGGAAAPGGLVTSFNVLAGDADRNGRVNVMDYTIVRARRLTVPGAPSAPAAALFYDIDGSNRIDDRDAMLVRRYYGRTLPVPPPAPSAPPTRSASPLSRPATRPLYGQTPVLA